MTELPQPQPGDDPPFMLVALDDIKFDPANARAHSRRNIDAIKASLARFGQPKNFVIDRDHVAVAGNGTVEAARELGWTHMWVTVFPGNAEEARAFAIADNRTAELAHWDPDQLLDSLRNLPPDLLESTGYLADDLADMVERFANPPGLDALGEQHGDPTPSALWPTLRIAMPNAVLLRYREMVADVPGDEAEQFVTVLDWADKGRPG